MVIPKGFPKSVGRVGTASPPKRENILTPQKATYKGGKLASWLSMLSILCYLHGLPFRTVRWINSYAATKEMCPYAPAAHRDSLLTN
jgi:hypothetical protein